LKPFGVVTDPSWRRVQRLQHFLGDLRPLIQNRIDHVGRRIRKAWQIRIALDVQNFVEDEAHVAQGCFIAGHGACLF